MSELRDPRHAADLMLPAAGIGVWEGARVRMDGSALDTDHGAVCHPATDGRWWVTFPRHRLSAAGPDHREIGLSRMSLDLTHRATRLEVMARLAERLNWWRGAQVGWVCVWMHPLDDWSERERRFEEANRTWRLIAVADNLMQDWTGRTLRNQTFTRTIPALADLDPTNDTRLPDGARLVDVQALAIVAAHVFGPVSSHPG